mgnify:CR=1 FL=1
MSARNWRKSWRPSFSNGHDLRAGSCWFLSCRGAFCLRASFVQRSSAEALVGQQVVILSLFSTLERFQLADEAFEWPKWLENSTLSLSYDTGTGFECRKRLSESLKPMGFCQVLNLG